MDPVCVFLVQPVAWWLAYQRQLCFIELLCAVLGWASVFSRPVENMSVGPMRHLNGCGAVYAIAWHMS